MRALYFGVVVAVAAAVASVGFGIAQTPEFRLGFKLLAEQIPHIVGQPIENEWHNPSTGDTLQRTTTGLMVRRKADSWTVFFTNGYRTWIYGPNGVQSRLNSERFSWESGGAAVLSPASELSGFRFVDDFSGANLYVPSSPFPAPESGRSP